MRDAFLLTLAVTLVVLVVAFTTGCGREAGTDAAQSFQGLDENQDGRLTRDELPERIAYRIMAADTDGDGAVTQAELKAAREKTSGPDGQAGVEAQGGPEAEGGAKPEDGPEPEDSPKPQAAAKAEDGPTPQADAKSEDSPKPQAAAKPEGGPKPQAGAKSEDSPKAKTAAKAEDSSEAQGGAKPQGRAEAQGGPGGRGRPDAAQSFQRLDKNQDGKLTRDELPERIADRIMAADTDGDGAVTQAELEAAGARMGGRRGPNAQGRQGRQGRPDPAQMFAHLDKNQDGKLTKDELPERMAERLMAADTNGDGAITKAEFEAAREKMGGRRGQHGGGSGNDQN